MNKRLFAVLLTLAALLPATVHAATQGTEIGPRIGFSSNPDQFVLGGQLDIPEVAPNISFDPALELGFGDHVTLVQLDFNLHYNFTLQSSKWRPYVGAGVGVGFFNFDSEVGGESDTNFGGNIIVGAAVPTRRGNHFFTELKLGVGDLPDLKLVAGWNFPM